MPRHKHADLMIAYANDDTLQIEIERAYEPGKWELCSVQPSWNPNVNYRIKPREKKKVEMWQWVVRSPATGNVMCTSKFYKDETAVHIMLPGCQVIGKAEWTRIEVEVEP